MRGLWGEAHFCGWTELCLLAGKVESGQEEAPGAVEYADLAKAGSPEGVRFRVPPHALRAGATCTAQLDSSLQSHGVGGAALAS